MSDPLPLLEKFDALTSDVLPLPGVQLPERLCLAAQRVLDVDAATICVFQGTHVSVPVAASTPAAAEVEELQFSIGDGPCPNVRTREPELLADLADAEVTRRWPVYASAIQQLAPYQAVFAFPLAPSARPLGVLKLYRHTCGELAEVATAAAVAARISERLLAAAGPDPATMRWLQEPALRQRAQVWHVQSLVMRANRIRFDEALDLLRACAFARGRTVRTYAEDVLVGRTPLPGL